MITHILNINTNILNINIINLGRNDGIEKAVWVQYKLQRLFKYKQILTIDSYNDI